MSSTTSAVAEATASAAAEATASQPPVFKLVGILLAVGSGLFIGASFVVKKKGLLSARAKSNAEAGEGMSYLKSPLWWTGMSMMIVGEILNFAAYAFAPAILVTPLGALSVVICAVLSSIFLKEKLTFFGKIGCLLCILGAVIIALNGPAEQTTSTIKEFQVLFLSPGFLVFGSLAILSSLGIILFVAPRWGKTHMLVYITICSLIGGLSVACTQGLGSSILTSIRAENQFKHWFMYFLLGFVIITLLTEVVYLNKALELFNTAMVTPTYYVLFTGATLITSVILYQGFKASVQDILTVVLGFLVICCGITLLQLSKVDPVEIKSKLDRRSTILLSAARSEINRDDGDMEKNPLDEEDPGMDALRGGFGAIGSIHRAMSARKSMRREGRFDPSDVLRRRSAASNDAASEHGMVTRHQLYDNPMPNDAHDKISMHSGLASPQPRFANDGRERSSSITFAQADTLHIYSPMSSGGEATHSTRTRDEQLHKHAAPPSADIANSFPSPSTASSYPPPTSPHYPDPFAQDPLQNRSQTLPRGTSGTHLASVLSQHFASSTPEFGESGDPRAPISPGTRSRFNLPSLPRTPSKESHRTARPNGPADVDAQESIRLVSRDSESDDEDRMGGRSLDESFESRGSRQL